MQGREGGAMETLHLEHEDECTLLWPGRFCLVILCFNRSRYEQLSSPLITEQVQALPCKVSEHYLLRNINTWHSTRHVRSYILCMDTDATCTPFASKIVSAG